MLVSHSGTCRETRRGWWAVRAPPVWVAVAGGCVIKVPRSAAPTPAPRRPPPLRAPPPHLVEDACDDCVARVHVVRGPEALGQAHDDVLVHLAAGSGRGTHKHTNRVGEAASHGGEAGSVGGAGTPPQTQRPPSPPQLPPRHVHAPPHRSRVAPRRRPARTASAPPRGAPAGAAAGSAWRQAGVTAGRA